MRMESKPCTTYWSTQGQKKEHLNRMRKIQFREPSAENVQIKENTNGIKTGSSKKILICSKSRKGITESSRATRFSNTSVDVQQIIVTNA